MGKLFGREKKPDNSNDEDVSAFLHGPSDKLYMTGSSAPPKFPKLDTSNARRWPTAAEVTRSRDTSRRRSASPKRSKKALIVRFTDKQPEIIGEGGDEAESPTLEISERKRSHSHPPLIQRAAESNEKLFEGSLGGGDSRRAGPAPTQRARIIREATPQGRAGPGARELNSHGGDGTGSSPSLKLLDSEPPHSTSTSARVQAEMRAAEGRAFKLASQSFETATTTSSNGSINENKLSPSSLPIHTRTPSPLQVPTQLAPGMRSTQSSEIGRSVSGARTQSAAVATGAEALNDFSNRLQHLYKLFRLSAESVLPISKSSFESWVRAASWWFLKGRASIEGAIRVRPSSPEGQRSYDILRQQGHADVAKALWIMRDIITQRAELKEHDTDDLTQLVAASRSAGDEYLADMLERCQAITINLRMLSMSMQRNNCLPPPAEDAPLPQGLDTSIWIKYPSFPTDVVTLLSGGHDGEIDDRSIPYRMKISEAMPLGDTRKSFEYARLFVDVIVMERGIESQQNRWPSIMFISRAQTDHNLAITISSQNGHIALSVKSDREFGLTWNDVNWQNRMSSIEIKLPRGFIARVQCSPNDFKTLWNMSDYTEKVHASFRSRKDEEVVFEATLKAFQYFDRDLQSRVFPKESIAGCHIRVLEKRLMEAAATGARRKHRGFRIAVITSKKTKNLNGISQDMSPNRPIQYALMRGDDGAPALLLKFEDGMRKPTMVFTFDNVCERSQLFSCLTGGVRNDETEVAYVSVKDFSITYPSGSNSPTTQDALGDLEWQGVRVIKKNLLSGPDSDSNPGVLSDSLRVIVDSKAGSVIDRINVEPGEMKIRLNPQLCTNEIMILRQPQDDLSISILESQVSKEMPGEVTALLEKIAKSQTIRKYCFREIDDLHVFQAAVTGFSVRFDGLAESFSISRRRSVVPIYKKWEAALARIQVLQHDKVMQIAAFFDNFSRGECMNFVIKVTDVFESFSRSGKYYLRIVDAKFAVPKGGDENYDDDDKGFVCLDMPNYPGEHDDITVTFDTEAGTFRALSANWTLTFDSPRQVCKSVTCASKSCVKTRHHKKIALNAQDPFRLAEYKE
jgi:hypothetical protein